MSSLTDGSRQQGRLRATRFFMQTLPISTPIISPAASSSPNLRYVRLQVMAAAASSQTTPPLPIALTSGISASRNRQRMLACIHCKTLNSILKPPHPARPGVQNMCKCTTLKLQPVYEILNRV